ncbi:INO80 complex subunit C [Saguinus oedipus]|uniref:INO80 complex subunit C n=1 Tax=Saguinus oedipus TaxID=9490 RepID=A0ABQ9UBJ9_SAGOE|nr:INO80 complex subunit C [Saguinus oedipus]
MELSRGCNNFLPFPVPLSTQANYTDPQSKLRFSTIEEFSYIRRLPSDVVTGYLALRKATSIVP